MKDLSLSLLSRGCGRSSSDRSTGGHDGRLDVCFTPRDYYIWQSKETLLRLSSSGHLFAEAKSSLPKTYSTRRGPLLLYSQDLVAMETNSGIETGRRKKRVVRRDTPEVQQHLRTLKELTAALLSFSNNQYISSRLAVPLFPPFHLPPAPKLHCPSPSSIYTTRARPSSEMLAQWSRQWLPKERKTEQDKPPKDQEEEQDNRKTVRLDLFLQMPSSSRTTTPQTEPQPWVHYVAMTPKESVERQTYMDSSPQPSGGSRHTEGNPHSAGGEIHHPNMKSVHDAADDQGCSLQDSGAGGDEDESQTSVDGNRHGVTDTGLLHPPLDSSVSLRPCWKKEDGPRRESPSRDKHRPLRLPPIAEAHHASLKQPTHSQQDVIAEKERVSFQSQETPARLHQQPLTLPPLLPEPEEVKEKQRGGREQTKRQYMKQDPVEQRGKGSQPSERGSVILLQPDGEPPPPPVGGMGGVVGWKGPGKQSSLAFLHHLHDPCGSSDTNRGVVRGVLPLQLRDFQNKKPAGSLILGPDGEIVQLSLYDSSQDPSQRDGDTRHKALQVLSTEGEELPWVIVLQPERAETEAGEELDDDGDTRHPQSVQKGAERHMPVGQVAAARFSTEQVLRKTNLTQTFHVDRHQSTETDAPSIHTDPMTRTKKKRKKTKAVTETWEEPQQDAKNKVRMPPLRERVGKGKIRGGNTGQEEEDEEDDDEEEEEKGDDEEDGEDEDQNSYSYGSNQSGEIMRPTDSKTRRTVDKKRKNTKRRAAEEAVITAGKRDVKSAESDWPKTAKTEKRQRKKPRSGEAQSIRSETEEEQMSGEAAETQEESALPSVKKKKKKNFKGREGGRGEVKMNEDGEDAGGETRGQKEATSRRRRRGKGKHKEEVAGSPAELTEGDEEESDPEMQKESHRRSTARSSATQGDSDDTTTEDDTDTDCVSTNDRYSSVRSVSSHRSTVASSHFNPRSSRRSVASSFEGGVSASVRGLAASRGRMSSCSTVMITEDQLMLNPRKPEFPRPTKSPGGEDAALLRRAQQAERRRQEEERKRREQEEEERNKQQREQTEDKMKSELDEERRKRAEGLRLKKLAEEEEGRRREEEEQERARREQAQRERERRRQEERRRQMEQLRRLREEEEQRRKDKLEHLRLEEEKQQEDERRMLQEMDESERTEYLNKKKQEQEERRRIEEEQRRREEEAAVEAQLLGRQMALLQQQLAFKRGLVLEVGGLEKTQCISRPWIYSYFELLQLLGPNPSKAGTVTP